MNDTCSSQIHSEPAHMKLYFIRDILKVLQRLHADMTV